MPKSQSKDCLTLDLKGSLPLEKFEKAVVAFFDLIKEVTKEALKEKQKIRWNKNSLPALASKHSVHRCLPVLRIGYHRAEVARPSEFATPVSVIMMLPAVLPY